jgi:hypothetical protein
MVWTSGHVDVGLHPSATFICKLSSLHVVTSACRGCAIDGLSQLANGPNEFTMDAINHARYLASSFMPFGRAS